MMKSSYFLQLLNDLLCMTSELNCSLNRRLIRWGSGKTAPRAKFQFQEKMPFSKTDTLFPESNLCHNYLPVREFFRANTFRP